MIGTLAERAVEAGFEVAIVTGDKDFFQLVHDGIKVYNPRDEGTWYDAAGVKEKFGVAPEQVVDVLALMGDSIDNIKGVPGIGEKGARDLIATYGSLEELLAHASEVSNKRYREGLLEHAEDARQSRELARIRTDVPVEFDPDAVRYRGASRERCFELFTRLGFRSLVMEYAPTAETVGKDYAIVESLDELRALGRRADGGRPLRLARACPTPRPRCAPGSSGSRFRRRPRHARYVPLAAAGRTRDSLRSAIEPTAATGRASIATPLSRSLKPLLEDDVDREGRARPQVRRHRARAARHHARAASSTDTMLASYLLDANSIVAPARGPGARAQRLQGAQRRGRVRPRREDVSFAEIPVERALDYAGERADLALQLSTTLRIC